MDTWKVSIKLLIKSQGISVSKLAEKAGKPRKWVYQAMNTKLYGPGVVTIDAILVAIGATWEDWGKVVRYVKDGGDPEAKDWETRYEKMLETPSDPKYRALLAEAEQIITDHEIDIDRAEAATAQDWVKTAALELWVARAKAAGVDKKLRPRILSKSERQRLKKATT